MKKYKPFRSKEELARTIKAVHDPIFKPIDPVVLAIPSEPISEMNKFFSNSAHADDSHP